MTITQRTRNRFRVEPFETRVALVRKEIRKGKSVFIVIVFVFFFFCFPRRRFANAIIISVYARRRHTYENITI